jgi:hypothetical protein
MGNWAWGIGRWALVIGAPPAPPASPASPASPAPLTPLLIPCFVTQLRWNLMI